MVVDGAADVSIGAVEVEVHSDMTSQEVAAVIRQALAESPDLYQPYRALGDAYRKSGELETALLMYKLALINSWKSQDSDMLGIFDGPTLIELARKQIEENVDEIEGKL